VDGGSGIAQSRAPLTQRGVEIVQTGTPFQMNTAAAIMLGVFAFLTSLSRRVSAPAAGPESGVSLDVWEGVPFCHVQLSRAG
jgi:hypothetical protein